MRSRLVVGLLLLSSGIAACGGSSGPSPAEIQAKQAAREQAAKRAAVHTALAKYYKCKRQIGPLLDAEKTLDSHLDVGLNYHDYGSAVGDVKASYDNVPISQLDVTCSLPGAELETALNAYLKASTIWDNCFGDINCSNDSIKGQLQTQWSKAKVHLIAATGMLSGQKKDALNAEPITTSGSGGASAACGGYKKGTPAYDNCVQASSP